MENQCRCVSGRCHGCKRDWRARCIHWTLKKCNDPRVCEGENASSDFFGFSFFLFLRFGLNCCGFVFVVLFCFFLLFCLSPTFFIYKDMNIFISEIGGYNVDSIENVSFSFLHLDLLLDDIFLFYCLLFKSISQLCLRSITLILKLDCLQIDILHLP